MEHIPPPEPSAQSVIPIPEMRLRFQLLSFTITRTILNTGYRMPYPFLPIFAAGLGVPLAAVAQAVGAARLLGVLAPVLGAAAERLGRKTAMLLGVGLFVVGMGIVAVIPSYWTLFFSVLLVAGGKNIIFDPALQAYIGDRVDYKRRGLAIAVVEMGWSGAFLIGMPLTGALISRGGWTAPFPWIAVCGVVAMVLLWRILPDQPSRAAGGPSLWGNLRSVVTHRTAMAALAMGLAMSAANETIAIIFAEWLKGSFMLTAVALGIVSTAIGVAELGGEGLVATFADRIGKRRAVIIGMCLNAAMCLLLPVIGTTFVGAVIGLVLIYITFEFALVASLPIMTEILPEARATLLASNVSSLAAGRALGAFIGPALFLNFGLVASSRAAAALDVLAVLLIVVAVHQD